MAATTLVPLYFTLLLYSLVIVRAAPACRGGVANGVRETGEECDGGAGCSTSCICQDGYYVQMSGNCGQCTNSISNCLGVSCGSSSGPVYCTGGCATGFYRDPSTETCKSITCSVSNCAAGQNICDQAGSGQARCMLCSPGFYITYGTSSTPDTCSPCAAGAVPGCADASPVCVSATVHRCAICNEGFYLTIGTATTSDTCTTCGTITSCGQTICTSGSVSRCESCSMNSYRLFSSGSSDTCSAYSNCPTITNCVTASISCTSNNGAGISRCGQCNNGYYRVVGATSVADTCVQCANIANCAVTESCTSSGVSTCGACSVGYYLAKGNPLLGTSDTCTQCAISNCPVSSCMGSALGVQWIECDSDCVHGFSINQGSQFSADTCNNACSGCSGGQYSYCSPGHHWCSGDNCGPNQNKIGSGPGVCTTCTPATGCTTTVCTGTVGNNWCAQCGVGYSMSWSTNNGNPTSNTCVACMNPINNCAAISCQNDPTISRCYGGCNQGYFRTYGGGSASDTCTACTPISPGCPSTSITCTTNSDQRCTGGCSAGYWRDVTKTPEVCNDMTKCTPISNCNTNGVTCTAIIDLLTGTTDSICSGGCVSGYWRDTSTSPEACQSWSGSSPCPMGISNCPVANVRCTSSLDLMCTACSPGYYRDQTTLPETCKQCTSNSNCNAATSLSCTTNNNQICLSNCKPGFTADEKCTACGTITDCSNTMCTPGYKVCSSWCLKTEYIAPTSMPGMTSDTCSACTTTVTNCGGTSCTGSSTNQLCTGRCSPGYFPDTYPPTSCSMCTTVPQCAVTVSCTASGTSTCTQCMSNYGIQLPAATSCQTCDSFVPNCMTGTVMCTTSSDAQCPTCNGGYYKTTGSPDTCTMCMPQVPHCTMSITTATCVLGQYYQCSQCDNMGVYLTGGICTTCMNQAGCSGTDSTQPCVTAGNDYLYCTMVMGGYWLSSGVSNPCTAQTPGCATSAMTMTCVLSNKYYCSSPSNGYYVSSGVVNPCMMQNNCASSSMSNPCVGSNMLYCSMASPGYYTSGGVVMQCGTVMNCMSVTCTTGSNQMCSGCTPGYYQNGGGCSQCTPVPNCAVTPVTCMANMASTCSMCSPGYMLVSTTQNTCNLIDLCATNSDNTKGCGTGNTCVDGKMGDPMGNPTPDWRTCTCPAGSFYSMATVADQSYSLQSPTPFTCTMITFCTSGQSGYSDLTYGCGTAAGPDPNLGACVPATSSRTCSCAKGYIINNPTGSAQPTSYNAGVSFPGCIVDVNECLTNPCGTSGQATCTESNSDPTIKLGAWKCTCVAPGYSFNDLTEVHNSVTEDCLHDLNECMASTYIMGFSYSTSTIGCLQDMPTVAAVCVESSTDSTVPVNSRRCTCPAGKYVNTASPDITVSIDVLAVPMAFPGCADIKECVPGPIGYDPTIHACRVGTTDFGCTEGKIGDAPASPTVDFRVCQCPAGFLVSGQNDVTVTEANVQTGTVFVGCTDINECVQGSQVNWSPTTDGCTANTPPTAFGCVQGDLTTPNRPDWRVCTCPAGYYVTGTMFLTTSAAVQVGMTFAGCSDVNECSTTLDPTKYGCTDIASNQMTVCVESSTDMTVMANYRKCTCPLGYYAKDSTSPTPDATVVAGAEFMGCADINECTVYMCADTRSSQTTTCTDSTNGPAVPINERSCVCPPGYYAFDNPQPTVSASFVLTGNAVFQGCAEISQCNVMIMGYGCPTSYLPPGNFHVTCYDVTSAAPNNQALGSWQCTCPVGTKVGTLATGTRVQSYTMPSVFPGCTLDCGDGLVVDTEQCDDANSNAHDGCFNCKIEVGWVCSGQPSVCNSICGDSVTMWWTDPVPAPEVAKYGGWEFCDDGNSMSGDGCSGTCQPEYGFYCTNPGNSSVITPVAGAPAMPSVCSAHCGDGQLVTLTEQCDDGNNVDGDGCTHDCKLEPGWNCDVSKDPTVCKDIDECNINVGENLCPAGAPGIPSTCASQGPIIPPNSYNCTCPLGYYITGVMPETRFMNYGFTSTTTIVFPGCTKINECLRYGCTKDYTVACTDGINNRTCACKQGTLEYGASEFLIGSAPPALICTEIDFCKDPGCGSFGGKAVPCVSTAIDTRTCTCGDNLAGSSVLVGNQRFSGCTISVFVSETVTLGYTRSNGYWNDWADLVKYDIDRDGLIDFFYATKLTGAVGWIKNKQQAGQAPTFAPIVINKAPDQLVCQSPGGFNDFPYSPTLRSYTSIVCLDAAVNGNIVVWIWDPEFSSYSYPPIDLLAAFGVTAPAKRSIEQTSAPASSSTAPAVITLGETTYADFNGDSYNDVLTHYSGVLYVFITAHTNTSLQGVLVPLTFTPDFGQNVDVYSPVFADFDGDGKLDFAFASQMTKEFYWFTNVHQDLTSATPGITYQQLGNLTTPSTPHTVLVNNFDLNPALDFIMTASDCYEMHFIPQFLTNTNLTRAKTLIFDGNCDGCGCGVSGGVEPDDINQDGALDLVNYLTGGVEILLNSDLNGSFVAQKVLGGADNGFIFDMEGNNGTSIVAIASGITVWYAIHPPDQCQYMLDNCTLPVYNNTICEANGWKGFLCHCPTEDGFFFIDPISELCLDFDECATATKGGCQQDCNNTNGGYNCFCNVGYLLESDGKTCSNINECLNVSLCDRRVGACNDTIGSYFCECSSGWQTDPTNVNNCIDVDECSSPLLNECDQMCSNSPGSYSCSCQGGYQPTYNNISKIYSDCLLIDCLWNKWDTWAPCLCGKDTTRVRTFNAQISQGSQLCWTNLTKQTQFCPVITSCKPLSPPTNLADAMTLVQRSFTELYFNYTWPTVFPVTIPVEGNTDFFTILTNATDLPTLLKAAEIIHTELCFIISVDPKAIPYTITTPATDGPMFVPGRVKRATDQSQISFNVGAAYPFDYTPVIVGLAVGIPCFIAAAILVWFYLKRLKWKALTKDMKDLPKACTKHYRQCLKHTKQWEVIQDDPPVYRKVLKAESDKAFVLDMFQKLDGEGIGIKEIYAVYNPLLVSSLGLTHSKFSQRVESASHLFFAEKWKQAEEKPVKIAHREWTKGFLDLKLKLFDWNRDDKAFIPILPTIHGTAGDVAWAICKSGFATLSSLDEGYYGSGIYFTTSAKYAMPYFATKPNPAIIISWTITGNAYPVIEHPKKKGNICGAIVKPGYQSHYVCTNNKGMPFDGDRSSDYKHVYDEIVINQEAQVAPAYVLFLDPASFLNLIKEFNRKISNQPKKRESGESLSSGAEVQSARSDQI